jgi:hypothetical protein
MASLFRQRLRAIRRVPYSRERLFVVGVLSFCLDRQCKFDQAANCLRARGLVFLLLGPALDGGIIPGGLPSMHGLQVHR